MLPDQYKCSSKITVSFLLKVDIKPAAIKSVTLPDNAFYYTSKPIEPDLTVKANVLGKSLTLTKDTDYTVTFKNNVKLGTAKAIVKGINLYKGTITKTFKIVKAGQAFPRSEGHYDDYRRSDPEKGYFLCKLE